MATPLLLYVTGLEPHMATGTGALAVSANAFVNLADHVRKQHLRWPSAILFAVFGIAWATAGSTLGKIFDRKRLLFLFCDANDRRWGAHASTAKGRRCGLSSTGS